MPNSFSFWDHPIESLEKALDLRKKIEALKKSVSDIMGEAAASTGIAKKPDGRKGKRSAATRAKMAAAAKARWAARKRGVAKAAEPAAKVRKKKRTMSPEARARIAAAQRARWAKAKAK